MCAGCVYWCRVREGWGVGIFRESFLNLILDSGELMLVAAG